MVKILFIAFGGAIGTALRYIVSNLDYKFSNGVFPVSTFIVNIVGSLVIGFLWGLFERIDVSSSMRMFIFIGILGGFTTFSSFSLENFNLFRDAEYKIAFFNIVATNLIGLGFVVVGFAAARFLTNIVK